MRPDTDEMVTTLPVLWGIIFWMTGLVTLKKPPSEVSVTLCQSALGIMAKSPSATMPALLTSTAIRSRRAKRSVRAALTAASSATSKGHRSPVPPRSSMSARVCRAAASLLL